MNVDQVRHLGEIQAALDLACKGDYRRVSFWRVREAVDDLVAENTSMRRLLGAYYVPLNAETNNVRPCTCILVRYQTHLEPEEWEQDPECDQHGDIRYVKTALAEAVDFLRRWRSTTIEPRGRTLTPDTDAFLAAHPEVPDA